MKTKVLILGSAGFIGSNLLKSLDQKQFEVFGADLAPSPFKDERSKIFTDPKQILEDVRKTSYEVIVNCVGSANVQLSFENPLLDFEVNSLQLVQLTDVLRKKTSPPKLIQLSSAAVYGNPKNLPIVESSPLHPISPYGLHKLAAENLVRGYREIYSLPTCSLRLFSVYGPGQCKLLFWDIFQKISKQNVLKLFGTGRETRDFMYIDDLVRAVESVISLGRFDGEAINVSSGQEVTISEAALKFIKILNPSTRLEFSGEEKRGDPKRWLADVSILKSFGFSCKTGLDEGLKRTAEAYQRENR